MEQMPVAKCANINFHSHKNGMGGVGGGLADGKQGN